MKYDAKSFRKAIKEILPQIEVIDEYKKMHVYVRVRDELDIVYSTLPQNLVRGKKPTIKSAIDKTLAFIAKANALHEGKYDYSLAKYINSDTKLKVFCPIEGHGEWEVTPANRLHKDVKGCHKCGRESAANKNKKQ